MNKACIFHRFRALSFARLCCTFLALSLLVACTSSDGPDSEIELEMEALEESAPEQEENNGEETVDEESENQNETDEEMQEQTDNQAKVIAVSFTGEANNYNFSVTLQSPDTGCDQYADWWEVFSAEGNLIYRRVLGHSHVNEQPFIRSGGTVAIGPDDFIYVRGHMNNLGYGTAVFSGTIAGGLSASVLETSFAPELASQEPLPTDCAF